jgi:hypothetical protein
MYSNINDKDGRITNLKGYVLDDVYTDIVDFGSIYVYLHADNDVKNLLEKNGFIPPTKSEIIIYSARNSEVGDLFEIRLQMMLRVISDNIVVKGSKDKVNKKYQDYRCWEPFYFNEPYSEIEYDRWIGSCEDLAANNIGLGLILQCEKIISRAEIIKIINNVVPTLKYNFNGNYLNIPLDSIAENKSY